MSKRVYILGGYQTDFSQNWARNGVEIFDMFRDTVQAAFDTVDLEPEAVDVAHVGNFAAELFCHQGHLGGFFAALHPAFSGLPTSRHEAACASGSIAVLAAAAEIEAERYGLAAIVGIEQMRNVPGQQAADYIGGPAMWSGHECTDVEFPWPHMFSELATEYDNRFGLEQEHLAGIAKINFANAKRNPNAQTRKWVFTEESFAEDDEANPVIEGRIRKQDCGQITDGAACVFLASEEQAGEYAMRRGMALDDLPYIKGWGHRTAPITYEQKIAEGRGSDFVFPHVRGTIEDAFARAGINSVDDIDGIETHDCFTTTEYMAIDHFGITAPGENWKAIEGGDIEMGGRIPVNASGGLIGLGHPVGATGVRMMLDSYQQVTGNAGDYQIEGAANVATLNIGGSATTTVSFVIGR
jgi:acetyl-CoA C-acetyltransferase